MRKAAKVRWLAAACAMACALSFAGCGTGGPGEPANSSDVSAESGSSPAATSVDASEVLSSALGSGSSEASRAKAPLEEPDVEALYGLLSEEDAENLIAQARTDSEAAWIAAHPDEYAAYGPVAQTKLITLAARDPAAVPYVRGFLDAYPAEGPDYDAPALPASSPSPDIPETTVPHLYQWDQRWGYAPYGGFCMGTSACGPTSLTMVYRALTGDDSVSPYDMAQRAYEWGYVSESGTGSEIMSGPCEELGLICWEVPAAADDIVAMLKDGHPLIANVRVGYFSDSGHFFVLAGVTDDGRVILNDPYSVTRSSQLWDPELIASEAMSIYAYNVAESE